MEEDDEVLEIYVDELDAATSRTYSRDFDGVMQPFSSRINIYTYGSARLDDLKQFLMSQPLLSDYIYHNNFQHINVDNITRGRPPMTRMRYKTGLDQECCVPPSALMMKKFNHVNLPPKKCF